jgi:high-affinity nickel-transport protein
VIAQQLKARGAFWSSLESIDMSKLGFAIVGLFFATWLIALLIWRAGRLEERWSGRVGDGAVAERPCDPS